MSVSRRDVLRLYKTLLTYSKSVTLTDSSFFKNRVSDEFRKNKTLLEQEEIEFAYKFITSLELSQQARKVMLCCRGSQWYKMMALCRFWSNPVSLWNTLVAFKHIDYSQVPKIEEHDLEEQFVRGSGPGGSAVNKNSNCVVLTHKPTGITVKCHTSRSQDENRKLARDMIIAKLDATTNGDNSVASQKKNFEEKKMKRNQYKRKKMAQLKNAWKEREGLL